MWVAYRTKLRNIPQEQQSIPPINVKFPISPKKYAEMLANNSELGEYLGSDDQFFHIAQSVYRKFAGRAMSYMAMAITTEQVDGMPQNRVYNETNTLDAILRSIDDGGL